MFDALDRSILAVLQENARLTNADIAARVGGTEPTVRRRVAHMLNQGLMRIVAVAKPFDLGFQIVAILGIQVDQARLSAIGDALVPMPEIRFAGITAGTYDIVVEVWFESTDQLVTFIATTLKRIPGIERVESIQVLQLLKYSYDWGSQPSANVPISTPRKLAPAASRPRIRATPQRASTVGRRVVSKRTSTTPSRRSASTSRERV